MDFAIKLAQVFIPLIVELIDKHHGDQHPDNRQEMVRNLINNQLNDHYNKPLF